MKFMHGNCCQHTIQTFYDGWHDVTSRPGVGHLILERGIVATGFLLQSHPTKPGGLRITGTFRLL